MAQLAPVLLPKPDASDPPVEAVELGVARVESSKATMKLPEGWGVVLPDAIHEKSNWATLDETLPVQGWRPEQRAQAGGA